MVKLASLIIALCRAIPALAGLFHAVSDGLRQIQAGHRLDAKNAVVDGDVADAIRLRDSKAGEHAEASVKTGLPDGP